MSGTTAHFSQTPAIADENEITIKVEIERPPNFIVDQIVSYYQKYRISEKKQQIKHIYYRRNYIKYYDKLCLPCVHTRATETPVNFQISQAPQCVILRMILYQEASVRISIDYEVDKYYLKGEIENVSMENEFYKLYVQHLRQYQFSIKFDAIDISKWSDITSRVFKNIYLQAPQKINKIKYKYDGYRAKLCASEIGMYTDSLRQYDSIYAMPKSIMQFPNLVYQLEVMSDKLILTDVLGAFIKNELYTLKYPVDVLSLFSDLDIPSLTCMKADDIWVLGQQYKLYAQCAIEPGQEPIDKIDGYIAVSDTCEYKIKVPTCDVEVKDKKMYVDGTLISESIYNVSNGIYEITKEKDPLKYIILRLRHDRISSSSQEEYLTFEESCLVFFSMYYR